jgi:predicted PurR-regulated permease PerM
LIYIGVIILSKMLVVPRTESMAVDIHPVLLAPIVVLGSTFGFWGAVLAGPLAVVTRDLFRYTFGRLSEPPRPAGLLPGVQPDGALAGAAASRVPLRQPRPLAADRQ